MFRSSPDRCMRRADLGEFEGELGENSAGPSSLSKTRSRLGRFCSSHHTCLVRDGELSGEKNVRVSNDMRKES